MKRDAIEVLVDNQIRALVEHGVAVELAQEEAERRVAVVLEEMNQLGLADVYVGVAIRRARVYRLRSEGVSVKTICLRLGIGESQELLDYRAELHRRRMA